MVSVNGLKILKRSGEREGFEEGKLVESIAVAGKDTKEYNRKTAELIAVKVMEQIKQAKKKELTVEEIRNWVEPEIAKAGFFKTAKYYILHGEQEKQKKRGVQVREPKLSQVARQVMAKRYLKTDLKGKVIETPGEMLWRVAKHMAKPEIQWNSIAKDEKGKEFELTNGETVSHWAQKFYKRMVEWKFVCAGKAMFEAGNEGGSGQLSSCFVLPIEDRIDSIFKTLGEAAVVHKNNGGTGFNFSAIRPHGDKVKNVPKAASGPVDFLRAFSAALAQILQGAKRQGANIAILNADHPDIEEFINLKSDDGTIKNFNISVGVNNKFMEAVERNQDWELINPRNGKVWKTVKAGKLFDMIAKQAWATGDPGLAFLDRLEADNPTPTLGKLEATNPCGEIPLLPYESCNLTSLCLQNHVRKNNKGEWEVDWEDLAESVELGIRFLDNMIEANAYPLEQIRQMVKEGNRRIGLGVMGLAHLFYKLQVAYDSPEAVRLSERLAKFIRKKAEETSLQLARERGTFPNFDISIYAGTAEQYRNCALMMIAPTGTTSLIVDTSSGIEPVFSLVTVRRSFNEDNRRNAPTKEFVMVDPVFEEEFRKLQVTSYKLQAKGKRLRTKEQVMKAIEKYGLSDVKGLPKRFYKVFVTTHQIAPEWHIRIQAAWQKWIDNSVSKTINFPTGATVAQVKKAYMLGWKLGLKGITIYRDGSKMDQVLNVAGKEGKVSDDAVMVEAHKPGSGDKQVCPECGAAAQFADGCVNCSQCGWSKCSL